MTSASTAAAVAAGAVGWVEDAADLPELAPQQPWHTAQWAAAWQTSAPEEVFAHRYLLLDAGDGRTQAVPFQLIGHSPLWEMLQDEAGVSAPWGGPVVYAPSLYGEYGGIGADSSAAMAVVTRAGLDLVREWGARALVVPNLTSVQALHWARTWQPDAGIWTTEAFTLPVHPEGLAAFGAALRARGRGQAAHNLERQHRRGTERGLTLLAAPGERMLPWLDQFAPLASATAARHGTDLYGSRLWPALARVPGAVLLGALDAEQRLVGGFFSFAFRGRLHAWAAGIDAERQRQLHTYTWLLLESIAYAARAGLHTLDLGRGNYRYKRRAGMAGQALHTLVYLADPDPEQVARLHRMSALLHASAQATVPPAGAAR